QEMKSQNKTAEDLDEPEDDIKAEYRKIAERRVRLGLLLAEVGEKNKIQVAENELGQALAERARQFPGQEKMVYEFYQKNPNAIAELRAPLFEDKVVDFIAELAKINDKTVTRDELFADPDVEEHEHVHDENCDHDHDHDHGDAKPAKKAAAKKPAAKKAAPKKAKED
ncbi:MAG: trigger factor, partial [Parvibaculum sp.]|nr:trigger factor [Parvibaculum sp.]